MQKSILITGRQGGGKTTKAKEIASQFEKDEVVYLAYRGKKTLDDPFLFYECTEKTKLIVFEEIYDLKQVEAFKSMVTNPITVNHRGKNPFQIEPKFILVCQSDIQPEELLAQGESFKRRFDLINCQYGVAN